MDVTGLTRTGSLLLAATVLGVAIFSGSGLVLTVRGMPVTHDRLPSDAAEDAT